MRLLDDELARLFALPEGGWVAADGSRRALILEVRRAGDWPALAGLLGGLQQDFDFPVPPLATCANGAFRLFFPLAEAVSAELAEAFLCGLQARYLSEVPERFLFRPAPEDCLPMPAYDPAQDRWTGFIDPSLGSLFAESGGLDFEPDTERQAELLRGVALIPVPLFEQAGKVVASALTPADTQSRGPVEQPSCVAASDEARVFLRKVMRDPTQDMSFRLQAAALLLQYPG